MDCGQPGSSIHGIFQARVLEWGAIAFSEKNALQGGSIADWMRMKSESASRRQSSGTHPDSNKMKKKKKMKIT